MPISLDDIFKKRPGQGRPVKPHDIVDREVGQLYDRAMDLWEEVQFLRYYGTWALDNLSQYQKRTKNYEEAVKWFGIEKS